MSFQLSGSIELKRWFNDHVIDRYLVCLELHILSFEIQVFYKGLSCEFSHVVLKNIKDGFQVDLKVDLQMKW